jgi:DNA-binding transcriptional LysR family regulator
MKLCEPLDMVPDIAHVIDLDARSTSDAVQSCKTRTPRISLKQWNMFHAVIDYDGYDGAADRLHVTQSTVSHAVAKLQEQLGVALLELKGRKAQITAAGQCLLERSRELVRHANALEALADTLHQSWGPDVRVAMDPGFPSDLLIQAVRQCSPSLHDLRLSVSEVTPDGARRALHAGEADIVIGAQPVLGFAANFLFEVEHIAVAHPAHPLFSGKRTSHTMSSIRIRKLSSPRRNRVAAPAWPRGHRIIRVPGVCAILNAPSVSCDRVWAMRGCPDVKCNRRWTPGTCAPCRWRARAITAHACT